MMKKFRFLMMAMAAIMLAGLASCKDDVGNVDDGEEDNGTAKAYLSININVPNDNSGTKADAEGDTNPMEEGTTDEFAIKNVTLYFFTEGSFTGTDYNYDGMYVQRLVVTGGFTGGVTTSPNVQYNSTTQTVSGLKADGTTVYHVYAIVNGSTSIPVLNSAITEEYFLENSVVTGLYATDGLVSASSLTAPGWTMASRNVTTPVSGKHGAYHTLTIPVTNSSGSPATAQLSVERIMGKLMITAHANPIANEYDVKYETGGTPVKYATVAITGTKVINTRNDGYMFRHMTQITTSAPVAVDPFFSGTDFNGFDKIGTAAYNVNKELTSATADYVIDPQTKNKTKSSPLAPGYGSWYTAASPAFGASFTAMTTVTASATTLGYCLENTMHSTAQLNGYTTGVVFEAKVTPEEIVIYNGSGNNAPVAYNTGSPDNHPTTFYSYGNMFYGSIEALEELGLVFNANTTDAGFGTGGSAPTYSAADKATAIKDLETNGVSILEGGICYYKYWITHQPNDQHMAVMEYGIVRNNVYKMKVTGISGIGESVEYILDPEEEDEHVKVYLDVQLDILPWIVRAQEDIIL